MNSYNCNNGTHSIFFPAGWLMTWHFLSRWDFWSRLWKSQNPYLELRHTFSGPLYPLTFWKPALLTSPSTYYFRYFLNCQNRYKICAWQLQGSWCCYTPWCTWLLHAAWLLQLAAGLSAAFLKLIFDTSDRRAPGRHLKSWEPGNHSQSSKTPLKDWTALTSPQ